MAPDQVSSRDPALRNLEQLLADLEALYKGALLAQARDTWRGTLLAVFQPGEETAEGAYAMIDGGLFKRFPKPDVVLGQHVMVGPSGTVAGRARAITSAADSLQSRMFGRGAHGSMPQASIDPVVMSASTKFAPVLHGRCRPGSRRWSSRRAHGLPHSARSVLHVAPAARRWRHAPFVV
jgi:hypothetical protein